MDTINAIKEFWRATQGNWVIRIAVSIWSITLFIVMAILLIGIGMTVAAIIGFSPLQKARANPRNTEAYYSPRHEGRTPRSIDDAFLFGPTPQPGKPQP